MKSSLPKNEVTGIQFNFALRESSLLTLGLEYHGGVNFDTTFFHFALQLPLILNIFK